MTGQLVKATWGESFAEFFRASDKCKSDCPQRSAARAAQKNQEKPGGGKRTAQQLSSPRKADRRIRRGAGRSPCRPRTRERALPVGRGALPGGQRSPGLRGVDLPQGWNCGTGECVLSTAARRERRARGGQALVFLGASPG